jgi:hypothetical protein
MGSLDTLPPDQRAVLDLVLQRGRSYDDIARLLAIDRAAVRARALAAFEALGPDTGIAPESRALITDYLLDQLPDRVAEQTRERLASSPYDRAWARVLASELAQVARKPLPEIPDGSRSAAATAIAAASPPKSASDSELGGARAAGADRTRRRDRGPRRPPRLGDRPTSRRGGAIMLGLGALVVVALVVVFIALLSSGSGKHSSSASVATGGSPVGTSSTASTTSTGPKPQVVGQVNLNPSSAGSAAKGVGFVVKAGSAYAVVIEAAHVAPNNHNFYAAWLYNSPTDSLLLGFVNPAVGKTGQLQVASPQLPANAGHFKQLLLTLETKNSPKAPGTIVLQGPFKGVPATG